MSLVNIGATLPPPMERQQQSKNNKNRKRRRRNNQNVGRKTNTKKSSRRVRPQQLSDGEKRAVYFHLSECSKTYARALVDPYNVESGMACIPDLIDLPSFKTLVISRGTFNVGSAQTGFVVINPVSSTNDATNAAVRTTTSSYAGASVANINTPTTGVTFGSMTAMPYTNAQVADGQLLARTVGCGLRIRYTGTALNLSGRLIPVRLNDTFGGFPSGSLTVAQILSRPEVPTIACDRKWHSVTYLPSNSSQTTFQPFDYLPASASESLNSTGQNMSLGWIVEGATAGNGFEYEIYIHKEYITTNSARVPLNTTASHSDVPGFSAVRDTLESSVPDTDGPSAYAWFLKKISEIAPQDISHVSEFVKSGAFLAKELRAITY